VLPKTTIGGMNPRCFLNARVSRTTKQLPTRVPSKTVFRTLIAVSESYSLSKLDASSSSYGQLDVSSKMMLTMGHQSMHTAYDGHGLDNHCCSCVWKFPLPRDTSIATTIGGIKLRTLHNAGFPRIITPQNLKLLPHSVRTSEWDCSSKLGTSRSENVQIEGWSQIE